jgi:DNA-binding PadR family transcriptional regulator
VPPNLIEGIWAGKSVEDEEKEKMRAMLAGKHLLPIEAQHELDVILSTESGQQLAKQLEGIAPAVPPPPIMPLLEELRGAGLLSCDAAELPDGQRLYTFHELVRERIAQWMTTHPAETQGRSREQIWRAYGERYAAAFERQHSSRKPGAMARATESGRRALTYLARARAFDQIGAFAPKLVSGTSDPAALRDMIE